MNGLWHRPYVLEDVATARAILGEHHQDADHPEQCASGTHLYPCEWPCPRWSWATAVLHAYEQGQILDRAAPDPSDPAAQVNGGGCEQRPGNPADGAVE